MSNYVKYYNSRKQAYTELAKKWAKSDPTRGMSSKQTKNIDKFFESIGVRFGLLSKFKELNLI